MAESAPPLFAVRNLTLELVDRSRKAGFGAAPMVRILDNLNFDLPRGSVTGIVGESGSGKTSLGRVLVRLYRPSKGEILFQAKDMAALDEQAMRPLRRDLQMIFQDPLSSLNPRQRIRTIVAAPLLAMGETRSQLEKVAQVLGMVGLSTELLNRYPHQLSGGQRQRVGIARAIILRPKFILADEIVSGLDVSSQARILVLLQRLIAEMGLTVAFISHDLSVISRLCDQVMVLKNGQIVENRSTRAIFDQPESAYTRALIAAIPTPVVEPGWLLE